MEKIEVIKMKIEQFLKKFKNQETITINETILLFKQIFKDEYLENNIYENHPYYKLNTDKLYIKNSYGIGLEIVSGPGDIGFGGATSHTGIDVYIFSKINKEFITLFSENEKEKNIKDINKLFDFKLSLDNVLKIEDDFVFKCLPESIKNNEIIINKRYEKLKREAEVKHEDDIEDDLISYYGGLDVTIHSTEEYLYDSLLINIEDTAFMEKAMPLFIKDFPDYISQEIDICEHALYMIEHKEEYYEIARLSQDIFEYNIEFNKIDNSRYEYLEEKSRLQEDLSDILDKIKEFSGKKYNIFDFFTNRKNEDTIKLTNLKNNLNVIKNRINEIDNEMNKLDQLYEKFEIEQEGCRKSKNEISSNLERKFEDFTLNPDFEDEPYIDGNFRLTTSLNRLIKEEKNYISKLEELKQMKSFSLKTIEQKIEQTKEENLLEYNY